MKKSYILPVLGFICMVFVQKAWSQEAYPFPQDVEYTYGQMPNNRNTAHAQAAYEAWKNEYVTTEGACGHRRVIFDFFPGTQRGAEDRSMTVSEGIAYGMLLAAYAGDRPVFDGLWGYYQHHANHNGFMHWKIQNCNVIGENGASDADLDVAMSLVIASYQWQSDDYLSDARRMIRLIREHQFDGDILKPGDMFGGWNLTNASYFSPHYYKVFKRYDHGHEQFWDDAVTRGYQIIEAAGGTTGLVPDFHRADGEYSPDASHYEEGGRDFIFDAVRTPLRSALDYLWHGSPEGKAYCEKIIGWLRDSHQDNPNNIGSRYATRISTSGNEGDKLGHHLNNTFLGCFAVGAMAADGLANNQSFVDEIYRVNQEVNPGYGEYFNATIKTIALFVQTGNFYLPPPDQCEAPDLGDNRSLCEGAITLDAGVSNRTYTWRRNNVTLSETGQTLQVSQAGDYEVVATDAEGCTRRSRVTVYDEEINADFTSSVVAGSIRLNNTSTGGISDYHWEVSLDGVVVEESEEENFATEILSEGAYEVTLTVNNSGFGCSDTDELTRTVLISDGEGWSANQFNDNAYAQPWIGANGYEELPRTWCSEEAHDDGDDPECLDLPCGLLEVNVTGGGQYDPFGVNFRHDDEDVAVDMDAVPYVTFRVRTTADVTLGVGVNDGQVTTNRAEVELTAGEAQVVQVEFPADNTTLRTGWLDEDNPSVEVDFTNIVAVNFFPMEDDPDWEGTITIEWITVGGATVPTPTFDLEVDENGFPTYDADGNRISTWQQRVSACDGEAVVNAQSCSAEEIRWYSGNTNTLIATGETAELAPGRYYVDLINQGGITRDTVEVRGADLEANFRYELEDNGLGLRLINTSVDFDSWEWSYGTDDFEEGAETWEEGYHYYEEEGEYEVCLYVLNETCGDRDTICKTIEIKCEAPMEDPAGFSVDGAEVGDTLTTCAGTEHVISVEEIENAESYAWYGMEEDALEEDLELTFTFEESHWIKFEAYNQCGEKVEDSLYVHVLPEMVAEFTATEHEDGGGKYIFEATWVGEEEDVLYEWVIDGETKGEGIYIELELEEGENTVELHVSGECGEDDTFEVIDVEVECEEIGTASSIEGDDLVCPNADEVVFTVADVDGATSYMWTVPETAEIIDGEGTNTITVSFETTGGVVSVVPRNACHYGNEVELEVNILEATADITGEIEGEEAVCSGLEDVVYTVEPVESAASYVWTVPAGAEITAGEETNSITVTFGEEAGAITVAAINECGVEGASVELDVVIEDGISDEVVQVSGSESVCSGAVVEFSVPEVAGATGYEWTIPAGAEISSADETASIVSITFGDQGGDVSVTPYNACAEGSPSEAFAVEISGVANPAGTITASAEEVCANATDLTFAIDAVDGADSYNWTLPEGAVITAGENTNEITVTVGTEGGTVSVTPISECGDGRASSIELVVNAPAADAGDIVGAESVCSGLSREFSIAEVENATAYEWTVTGDATIEGDASGNTVTIAFGSEGQVEVSVTPISDCGNGQSAETSVLVIEGVEAAGAISGDESVCAGAENVQYSIEPVAGAESYTWTVPAGADLVGDDNGTSVVVNFNNSQGGDITVTPHSECGEGTSATLPISVIAIPSIDLEGEEAVCANESSVYTVTEVEGASYNWTVSGAQISSGQNTNEVTVNFESTDAHVSVIVTGGCANETATLDVTVNDGAPTLGAIDGLEDVCSGTAVTYSVDAVAGVNSYEWTVPSGVSHDIDENSVTVNFGTSGNYTLSVTPVSGCGDGEPVSINVAVDQGLGATGDITGSNAVCVNQEYTFEVPEVSGATRYKWILPSGATAVGNNNEREITVRWSENPGGEIRVIPAGECGSGSTSTLTVSAATVCKPGDREVDGPRIVYTNSEDNRFAVDPVEGSTYSWTVPEGAIITSASADSSEIFVTFGDATGEFEVTLREENSEGAHTTTFPIAVSFTTSVGEELSGEVTVAPNPTEGVFYINLSEVFNGSVIVNVRNAVGSLVYSTTEELTGSGASLRMNVSDYPSGIYMVEIQTNDAMVVKRVIKN
ncbi:glycosyl hydrolase family 8 [Cytophagaceae bacterium ABcell3]|nr:glycosyl hydrolase family 8 [Cytophagaceae bacterium ABcell3]